MKLLLLQLTVLEVYRRTALAIVHIFLLWPMRLEIDHENYQHKPKKHEVLRDFGFLQRITGKHIAETVLSLLAKHNIDIANCRGQSYDTTASMSSSAVGVQAFIKKSAPDSDYQGYCLHSLNLVVCKASQISAVRI